MKRYQILSKDILILMSTLSLSAVSSAQLGQGWPIYAQESNFTVHGDYDNTDSFTGSGGSGDGSLTSSGCWLSASGAAYRSTSGFSKSAGYVSAHFDITTSASATYTYVTITPHYTFHVEGLMEAYYATSNYVESTAGSFVHREYGTGNSVWNEYNSYPDEDSYGEPFNVALTTNGNSKTGSFDFNSPGAAGIVSLSASGAQCSAKAEVTVSFTIVPH